MLERQGDQILDLLGNEIETGGIVLLPVKGSVTIWPSAEPCRVGVIDGVGEDGAPHRICSESSDSRRP